MRKILSVLIVFALVLSLSSAALAASLDNFTRVNSYANGQFTDVNSGDWFAENVKTAYELGLMVGDSETFFNAAGNISIAETVTLAARLHSLYNTGEMISGSSEPWYQVYVDYAKANGIITGDYANYDASATRAQFAVILAASLPKAALDAVNTVQTGAIPDVKGTESYGPSVYKLYRAGVLTGNDARGTFTPNTKIERSAVAAIVTRMAVPSLRKNITLIVDNGSLMVGKWVEYIGSSATAIDYKIRHTLSNAIEQNKIYFTMENCGLPLVYEFRADGTGTAAPDAEMWNNIRSQMKTRLVTAFEEYLSDQIAAHGFNTTPEKIVLGWGYSSIAAFVDHFIENDAVFGTNRKEIKSTEFTYTLYGVELTITTADSSYTYDLELNADDTVATLYNGDSITQLFAIK